MNQDKRVYVIYVSKQTCICTNDVVQGRWDRPVNRDKRVYVIYVSRQTCICTNDVVQGRWDRPVNQDKRVYVQFVLYSMYCIIWPMNPVCTFAQSCGMSISPTVRIQAACRTAKNALDTLPQ